MMYRRLILSLVLLTSFAGFSQEGFKLGIEASPAWHVNVLKQKTTGLRSTTSGYGFNVGVPIRWGFSEYMSLQTGITFEIMMFDERINKTLNSSIRHGSIHVPLQLNYQLSGAWYVVFGGGINYNVFNTFWNPLGKVSISGAINSFQPYGALGISTLMERNAGLFELGAMARFHFIDLYKPVPLATEDTSNRILSFDLILRWYLINK